MTVHQSSAMVPVVVFIEDNLLVARSIGRALGDRCAIRHASRLADALPMIEAGDFSGLLCDWFLDDGTGEAALVLCAERSPDARRVLLTGQPVEALRARLAPDLAHVILEKSCDIETIAVALGLPGC